MSNDYRKQEETELGRRAAAERRRKRRQQRRRAMILRSIVFAVLLVLLVAVVVIAVRAIKGPGEEGKPVSATASQEEETKDQTQEETETQTQKADDKTALMEEADLMAAGYDYDGAIELLKTIPGYESDAQVTRPSAVMRPQRPPALP